MARPTDPRAALDGWLATAHRWLTVVGPPGMDLQQWVEAGLAERTDGAAITVVEGDGPAPPTGRVICVDHRRHRHPDEVIIELGPLPRDEAIERLRAEAGRAGLELPEDTAAQVVERVGGHPLALRLLARRLAALTLPELIERLDALPSAGRDPLMHAATPPWDALRRALDRAAARLPASARAALAAAALFAGGFTVSALSKVVGGDQLDAVQALRDHSLIAGDRRGLWLIAVVRRYARAHLPPPPEPIASRFAAWRAEQAEALAALARRGAPEAVERIAAREAELRAMAEGFERAALDDGQAAPGGERPMIDAAAACDADLALAALCEHRRSSAAQRRSAERAARVADRLSPDQLDPDPLDPDPLDPDPLDPDPLDPDPLAPDPLDLTRRVAAHAAAARACRLAGDAASALRWLERVRPLGEPGADGPPALRFMWCHERGALASTMGERSAADGLAAATLAAARAMDDPLAEARALISVGVMRHHQHDLDGAAEAYTAARHISHRVGAHRLLGISALNICLVDVWRNRLDAARAAGEEALTAFVALGDRRGEGTALNNLGMIALEQGALDVADTYFAAAEACHAAIGFRPHQAHATLNRAEIALERGDRARHDRLIDALHVLNAGHPEATGGPSPLRDRALSLEIARGRVRSALRGGALDAAEAHLADARTELGAAAVPAEVVEVELLAIELALARGDHPSAEAAWARADATAHDDRRRARQRVELMALALDAEHPDAVERLADGLRAMPTSLALRRTMRAVWANQPREVRREARARAGPTPSVCLDMATHTARLPDGRWVSLTRRRLLWTLLTVLFDAEQPLAADAVIAAVWPGEQIQPEAANNRLYNAVALLRKAGLGRWLARDDAGYRLDPTLARVRLSAPALSSPDGPG